MVGRERRERNYNLKIIAGFSKIAEIYQATDISSSSET